MSSERHQIGHDQPKPSARGEELEAICQSNRHSLTVNVLQYMAAKKASYALLWYRQTLYDVAEKNVWRKMDRSART
jgi:hypothetical protein